MFNTSDANFNLVEEVRKVTEGQGTSITVDATGNAGVIKDGLELTARRGQMILVGAPPPDAVLNVHLVTMLQVRIHQSLALIEDWLLMQLVWKIASRLHRG